MFVSALVLAWVVACAAGEEGEKRVAKKLDEVRTQAGAGFIVEREGLFVVAGNVPRGEFDGIVAHTIRRCANALWASYFTKKPDYPIVIWLFADDKTYRDGAKRLFGDTNVSHFGYFRPWDQTMVMNVGTGTGTLVHEMTHALLKPDFPECPTWFEEGLSSLHEQCSVSPQRLVGLVNWRLPGLQKAIKAGTVPSFKDLAATTTDQFYNKDKGNNYAQARYLCYYLQEQGKLAEFYKEFRAGCREDPTGFATLKKVLGEEDMDAFKKKWEAFVMGLSFP